MTETPLSDAMTAYVESRSVDDLGRFVELFAQSVVGFVAVGPGVPAGPGAVVAGEGAIGAGRTMHGDGRARLLAFADPEVSRRNFGARFNAGMSGAVLLRMAVDDPGCEGILVNHAVTETAMIISKENARIAVAG